MKQRSLGDFLKKNWMSLFVLLYLISPLDFLPDDIPLLGSIDDASLLLLDIIRQYLESGKEDVKKD